MAAGPRGSATPYMVAEAGASKRQSLLTPTRRADYMEHMIRATPAVPIVSPVSVWLVALAVTAIYLVTMENGAVLAEGGRHLHDLFHDGRHFLGVPCH